MWLNLYPGSTNQLPATQTRLSCISPSSERALAHTTLPTKAVKYATPPDPRPASISMMLLNKPSLAAARFSLPKSAYRISCWAASTSSTGLRSRPCEPSPCPLLSGRRGYATVNDWRSGASSSNGPSSWPKGPNPTPYEIFGMSQNAPYTKKRFYELVKLYHPDKHDHSTALDHIPQAVRLERYRLIVAANDLLSDVAKRRLYDNHGLGWTGTRTPTINESVRYQDHLWRDREHSPAGNATWEDWERWHQRRDGKPTEPLYMSNGVFATLIVALCMIGAFTQMSRAENIGNQYIDQVDRLHTSVAADVQKSAVAAQRRNRDEQVESFLRDRENAAFVFVPSRYDATQKRE